MASNSPDLPNIRDPRVFDDSPIWDMDRRTTQFRRLVHAVDEIYADLGGMHSLSFQQRAMAEQFVLQREWVNQKWKQWLDGKSVDMQMVMRVSNTMLSIANQLGLERRTRDVSSLKDVLEQETGGDHE